jgi:hypothetical protein
MVGGLHYRVDLKDTSGTDYYDTLRPLDYTGTDIFLVCFSVVSPTSFDDVKNKVNDFVFITINTLPAIVTTRSFSLPYK